MHQPAHELERVRPADGAERVEGAGAAARWRSRRCERYVSPLPLWGEMALWLAAGLLIAAAYVALLNPYWSLNSDSDFYLALARNLAQGEGFVHNGNPVGLTPPGWPLLLAGAMQITTKLGMLKLVNTTALLVFLAVGWWVLRRVFGPWITATAILLVGFSPIVVEMNWLFLSDPSFCALAICTVWAGQRAHESGRGFWAWVVLCALLAASATTFRWTGILLLPLIGAALFDGAIWWRLRLEKRWLALGLVAGFAFGTFFGLRLVMPAELDRVDPRFPATMVGKYELVNSARITGPLDYVGRLGNAGYYLGEFLWLPIAKTKLAQTFCGRLGTVLVVCCIAAAIAAARRRRWLLLGAICYCLPIVMTWPSVVPRYLLAAMPILVAGALAGLGLVMGAMGEAVLEWIDRWNKGGRESPLPAAQRRRFTAHGFAAASVGSFVVLTMALQSIAYVMEYNVARSNRQFGRIVDGGIHRRLPSIARELDALDVQPGEVAVSERQQRRTWVNRTHSFMRALYAMTDRPVRAVPFRLSRELEGHPDTLEWLREHGVRYYAYLPPYDTTLHYRGGRLEAFIFEDRALLRIPEEQLQETDWRLYEIDDSFEGGFRRMELPPSGPPKRVPHLSAPPH